MELNKERSTDLKKVANYPRRGRKAFFGADGVIAKVQDKQGNTRPSIEDMTIEERKKYGKQPQEMK